MKIKEVVAEGALDDFKTGLAKGKDLANRVLTPSRWVDPDSKFAKDFQTGQNFAKKVLNPFSGGSSSSSSQPKSSGSSDWQIRDSLKKAKNGDALQTFDRQALKQIHTDIQSGKIKADQNTIEVLKSAYSNQQLSDEQRQQLAQLLNQY